MIKNYIKLAYRSLRKNKIASVINVAGLAIAIGCSIVAYMFISSQLLSEMMHVNADKIYLVEMVLEQEGNTEHWGSVHHSIGPRIAQDHSHVERAIRIEEARLGVKHQNHSFYDIVRFVDPGYLDLFTIPLKYGSKPALNDPGVIILSEDTAVKYFGASNPVGLTLTIENHQGEFLSYTVQGVAEKFPIGSVANFSILTAYENYGPLVHNRSSLNEDVNWSNRNLSYATFLQLPNANAVQNVETHLNSYLEELNADTPTNLTIQSLRLNNLKDLALTSEDTINSISRHIPWAPIIVLSTITAFLFLLSCFNYINITLGNANTRIKEIGIRKVIGGRQEQLIWQFLTENLLLCFLALVAGVMFSGAFLLPAFNTISGNQFQLEFIKRFDLWYFLFGILIFTALVSGAYPALYISSLKPTAIFSGAFKSRGPNQLMKGLLTIQFTLALITLIVSIGFTLNISYLKEMDWGYDKENTLVIRLSPENYHEVYGEALQIPQAIHIAGASNHIGMPSNKIPFTISGVEREAFQFNVGQQYFDIIKPRLVAGAYPSRPDQILVNSRLAAVSGSEINAGSFLTIDNTEYQVAGIVEDFHYTDFSDPIEPLVFTQGSTEDFQYLLLRLQPGTEEEAVQAVTAAWNRLIPETGLNYYFQDESFQPFFGEAQGITNIFYFTAIIAMLRACAGLFGIASQYTVSKIKEMSIGKVLGASASQIVRLVNRPLFVLLLLSILLAIPAGYALLTGLMGSFANYQMPMGPAPFIITTGLVVLIVLLTLSAQIYQLVTLNPADSLRDE